MKNAIFVILIVCLMCSGCAAGAATAGYALHSRTADNLSAPARQSIIDEVKEWVKDYCGKESK